MDVGLCSKDAVVQNGGMCFLVSTSMVLSKSQKLLKMLSLADRKFLMRMQNVKKGDPCPAPPANLQRRYAHWTNDSTDRIDTESGDTDSALMAFLSTESRDLHNYAYTKNFILLSSIKDDDGRDPKWSRLPYVLRNKKNYLNKLVHQNRAVILNLYLTAGKDQMTGIGPAFGRTLQTICSTNDHILGGFLICYRKLSTAEKRDNPSPNGSWTKQQLKEYITNRNRSTEQWKLPGSVVKNEIPASGSRAELVARLKSAGYYGMRWETVGHSVGFTVCHETDENSTTRTQKAKVVLCNWDKCYKGNDKFEDFRNALLELNKSKDLRRPRHRLRRLVLVLA